jgi:two-component system NarL family response regulator
MNGKQAAQTTRQARLVIADDHELVRVAMRTMLAGEGGLEVVGEAATGHEALALCRKLQPDLALIDVRMPGLDGLTTTRLLRQECPETRVIVVTEYLTPDYILEALDVGAAAYILKETSLPELVDAIRRVLRGETLLNREVATELLRRRTGSQPHMADLPSTRLTPRELQLLQLFATTRLGLLETEAEE